MNKYLLMSAAAVFATTANSYATPAPSASGSTSFYSTDGTGFAYCNEWHVTWVNKFEYVNSDSLGDYCSGYTGYTGYGNGTSGKNKQIGKHADLPSTIAQEFGYRSLTSDFVIQTPVQNGGWYFGQGGFSNYSVYEFSAGLYFLGQYNKVSPNKRLLTNGHATPAQVALFKYAKAQGHNVSMPSPKK